MPPSSSELKVIPSFCFAFKIPDDVTATNKYVCRYMVMVHFSLNCRIGHISGFHFEGCSSIGPSLKCIDKDLFQIEPNPAWNRIFITFFIALCVLTSNSLALLRVWLWLCCAFWHRRHTNTCLAVREKNRWNRLNFFRKCHEMVGVYNFKCDFIKVLTPAKCLSEISRAESKVGGRNLDNQQ